MTTQNEVLTHKHTDFSDAHNLKFADTHTHTHAQLCLEGVNVLHMRAALLCSGFMTRQVISMPEKKESWFLLISL